MTGASLNAIKDKLIQGHLVVVWVAKVDGFVKPALTLTGYKGNHCTTIIHGQVAKQA